MTTYVLSLMGDEEKAADTMRWGTLRKAKRVSISRRPHDGAAAADEIEMRRAAVMRDPQAMAALLVRTLDTQDGAGVVLVDFDSEEFAAAVLGQISALGRAVKTPST